MESISYKWDVISGIATFFFIGFLVAALFAYFYQPIEINYQLVSSVFGFAGVVISVIALIISGLTYQKLRQKNRRNKKRKEAGFYPFKRQPIAALSSTNP